MVSYAVSLCRTSIQLSCKNHLIIAANLIFPADADDPFAISPEAFESGLGVNVTGGYAALHHATRGFKQLREAGSNVPLAFIATGNVTPFQPTPVAMTLSSGKAALANLIDVASLAYKATNYGYVREGIAGWLSRWCITDVLASVGSTLSPRSQLPEAQSLTTTWRLKLTEVYTGTQYNLRGTTAAGTCALPWVMAEIYLKIGTEGSIAVRNEDKSVVPSENPKSTRPASLCFDEMYNGFCCWYHISSFA
jgi:hypothetical protein